MKKIYYLFALFLGIICFSFAGCGDPYANMQISVSTDEIVLYMNPESEDQSKTAEVEVSVSGIDTNLINQQIEVKYLTTENVVTASSIKFDKESGKSTVTLEALSKGNASLIFVSKDNDNIVSKAISVRVVNLVESFSVKSNANISLATGESLDLSTLDIFNFSNDTDQTEMTFSILRQDDTRYDQSYTNVSGVDLSQDGILSADEECLGGIVQIVATSKYLPANATADKYAKLSKVFKVMVYKNFQPSDIEIFMSNDISVPINIADGLLLTRNVPSLNPQTIIAKVRGNVVTSFNYSVKSNQRFITITPGEINGLQSFMIKAEDSGQATLTVTATVVDSVSNTEYVKKSVTIDVSCIRVVKQITLSADEVDPVTNGTIEIDVYQTTDYDVGILGTSVGISLTPKEVENRNFVLRIVSTDGNEVTDQNRNDIIVKTTESGNTNGRVIPFGSEINSTNIFVSYFNSGLFTSNFVIAVVANSFDERLTEVVAYIKCNIQMAVGDIVISDNIGTMLCIGDEVNFSFRANGESNRFSLSFSTPGILSIQEVNEQRNYKIVALREGETILTVKAKGTGNYKTVKFKVVIILQNASLSVPNHNEVSKITQTIYGDETIDDEGLPDTRPLSEVAVQTSAVFVVSTVFEPSNATVDSITFESSNPGFVSVDSSGRVVAYGMPCNATITATFVYQVREQNLDGSYSWSEKTSVRSFRLVVYKPITSVVWFGGTNRAYVEVWDYNSLSKTDQMEGKATVNMRAMIYPSTATARDFQWQIANETDEEYVSITPTQTGIIITGFLPLDFVGDEYEVTVNGWVTEYGVEHSLVCIVKIKKPQHVQSIGIVNYDSTQGIYLESAGASGVSNASWELLVNTMPNEALSHEVSYVLFNAEMNEETNTLSASTIAAENQKLVQVGESDGKTIITPILGKRGYTIMRIIPSSLLNQDKPEDSMLNDDANPWVNAVLNAQVYCDVWILVADGSLNAPFQIIDVQDFCDISKKGLDKNYVVKRNLDFSGFNINSNPNWLSLGGIDEFTGSISSFNYGSSDVVFKLYGLTINTQYYRDAQWNTIREKTLTFENNPYVSYIGLFGKNNGTIRNLEIVYNKIVVDSSSIYSGELVPEALYVGAVAGYNGPNGIIQNVSVLIKDTENQSSTDNSGIFIIGSKSDNRADTTNEITNISCVGGIVGFNAGLTKACTVSTKIFGQIGDDPAAIGGIVGFNMGKVDGGVATIEEVLNPNGGYDQVEVISKSTITVDMQIDGASSNFDMPQFSEFINYGVGGVCGVLVAQEYDATRGVASILNYDVGGSIVAEQFDNVGGLVGSAYGEIGGGTELSLVANVNNCSASTHVFGATNVGGVAGYSNGATYYKSYYECYQAIVNNNEYANTAIRGLNNVGGFIGRNLGYGQIQYCYASSYVPLEFVYENGKALANGQFRGDVIASNGSDNVVAGGFIGTQDFNKDAPGLIQNCYAKMAVGIVKGTAGGFIGLIRHRSGNVVNCYSLSRIICTSSDSTSLGGFVGEIQFANNSAANCIEYCYCVSGLSVDGNNAVGVLYGRYTDGEDVLYNSVYNFIGTCGAVTNIEFDYCYYADANAYAGKKNFGAFAVLLGSMKGYQVSGNTYANATAPAFGVGLDIDDMGYWFRPDTGWVPYHNRIDLNNDLPTLYLPDGLTPMMNTDLTDLQYNKAENLYNGNNQILPVFFRYDDGKIVAVLSSMNVNVYNISQIVELVTTPTAGLKNSKVYVTSSNAEIVSVLNPTAATYFANAKLVFNKTGTVVITIMSATNFDVNVSFQICVIAGFSDYALHQSSWVSGEDSHTISIKIGQADVLVPYLTNNTRFNDEIFIRYQVSIDSSLPNEMTYDKFASFVNFPWEIGINCFYVTIPIRSEITHLLEALESTAILDGLMLNILAQLQLNVYFFNDINELLPHTITFDEQTIKNLFKYDINNRLVSVVDDVTTAQDESVVSSLDTIFRVRVYKGVSGAVTSPTSAETETSRVQPVSLTVYTDATDVLLENLGSYVKAKLEVNDTVVVSSLLGETQILAPDFVTQVGPLNESDLQSLVNEIACFVSGDGAVDLTRVNYHENIAQNVVFNFNIGLYEKYLSEEVLLTYTFVIYDDLFTEVDRKQIQVLLKPTRISKIDVLHYLNVSDIAQGKSDSDEISSGQTGLLVVNVYNSYSDFDYITVTSSYAENEIISFVQVEKNNDMSRFSPLDPRSVYIDNSTIKGVKTEDYTGSFFFTTTLGAGIPKGTLYVLTIRAYKIDANGNSVVQMVKTKRLAARYVPFMNLSVDSPYGNIVARGTEVTINMNGSVTNSNVTIEIPSENKNLGRSSIISTMGDDYTAVGYRYTPANAYEAENGKQVSGSFKLYVGPEATCTEDGILVQAVTTTVTTTGGTESVVFNLYLKLVDFVVESLGVEDVSNGAMSPSMENTQDLDLYFNVTPSTLELFNQRYSSGSDDPLSSFLNESAWASLNGNLSELGHSNMPGTLKQGTKLADEKGYVFYWTTSGGTANENLFKELCRDVLFENCGLKKEPYEEENVGAWTSLLKTTANSFVYRSWFKNPRTNNMYDFVYGYAINDTEIFGYNVLQNEIVLIAKVVEEEDVIIGRTQTSFSNIREAVAEALKQINTKDDGYSAIWYYGDGSMFRALSSTNNTCPNFDVSFTEGRGYSITGKTLNPTIVEAGIRAYYEFENGVFRFRWKDINSDEEIVNANIIDISTRFTVQFRNTSTLDRPTPIYDENGLRQMIDGGNYMLMADIEVSNWTPSTAKIASFDGNGHIVSINGFNLSTISNGTVVPKADIGFFNTVESGTIVKNFILDVSKTVYVNAKNIREVNFGFIAGVNNGGVITNCEVITTLNNNWYDETSGEPDLNSWLYYANLGSDEIESSAETVFEQIKSKLRDNSVVNKPTIASTFLLTSSRVGGTDVIVYTGGIVGQNKGGYITNSRVGRVTNKNIGTTQTTTTQGINIFSSGNLGGITGYNSGVISSSYFANGYLVNTTKTGVEVSVGQTSSSNTTGGLVAYNDAAGLITTSYVIGMENSINSSTGRTTLGGLYSYGTIGGFVNTNEGTIENCYANISISTQRATGGFVYNNAVASASIKYSYSMSAVTYYSSNNGPFTGIDKEGRVLNVGSIEYCYYLVDNNYLINDDEKATGLSGELNNGKSEWNDPNGAYFVGFVLTIDPDSENAKMATWVMPDSSSNKKGPQLVEANTISVSSRKNDYKYESSYSYGSSINPYLIATAEQFNQIMCNLGVANNVRLIADIDFDGNSPLTSTDTVFTGVLRGNGMSVKNYSLSLGAENTTYSSLGLFKKISSGVVSNLNLEIETEFSSLAATFVGGLAGQIDSSLVENVKVKSYGSSSAQVKARNVAGGLAGIISGDSQIENISSYVSVYVDYATIQYESSNREPGYDYRYRYFKEVEQTPGNYVYAQSNYYSYAGGVAGIVAKATPGTDPTIVNCLVGGSITIRGDIVGGLFGVIDTNVVTSRLQFVVEAKGSSQKLWAENFAGGLVGENRGKITQSYVSLGDETQIADDIALSLDQDVASHIGYENLFQGETTNAIGGLVGLNRGSVSVTNNGGAIQVRYYGVIETSFNRVAVVNPNAQLAGGIIGLAVASNRIEDATEASQTNVARNEQYINVRNIFGINDIYYLTGSNTDRGVYFGSLNETNNVYISGSISEVWSTGAVYAGGQALANVGSGYMFTTSAAGGFAGAFVDPMHSADSGVTLALINNQLRSTEVEVTNGYKLGSLLGHVAYKMYQGTNYNAEISSLTSAKTNLFITEPSQDIFGVATASASGVSKVYTNATLSIKTVALVEEESIIPVFQSATNYTLRQVVSSSEQNRNAFACITSDIWQKDNTLESTIFPVIKMGKIVTQLSIENVDEFLQYMQGGVGGKYLLTRNITITKEKWGNRKSLTNGGVEPISGTLRGYVGNGEAATITLSGFCEGQLKTFDSLFGFVSGFTLSNINFVFPEGIESTGENVSCDCGEIENCGGMNTNQYFGLIAYQATGFSNFENLSISIAGNNKNILVNNKSAVGAFVGKSDNCTFTNLRLNDQITFINSTYNIRDSSRQSSFGGLVGETSGKADLTVGDFGSVLFKIGTARTLFDNAILYVGGLVGSSTGSLKIGHSVLTANLNISAPYAKDVYMGGIVGCASNGGEISYSVVNATLNLTKPINPDLMSSVYFGGVAGDAQKIELKGNTVTGENDWSISTKGSNIYAGGVAGRVTSSIVYGTNSLIHSGAVQSNSADFNLSIGSEIEKLEDCNVFFGGIVGEFAAKTSGTANQVPPTTIIGQNASLGDVVIYGEYTTDGTETQCYIGGIVANITNDAINYVSTANNYCVVSENISLENIRAFGFFNTYFGGIVGQSYFIVQNCASYGILSYTSTGTGADNIKMAGIVGMAYCPLLGCYTTASITQYGLDISREKVVINAIVGKGSTRGVLLTNCYYNFELTGVLDAEATATRIQHATDMLNASNFVFSGVTWATRQTSVGNSFVYPQSLAKYIDFSVGGNMVPVYANNFDELVAHIQNDSAKNKIIIVNFEKTGALTSSDMGYKIENCSRLVGNGVVLDFKQYSNSTPIVASVGQNIGVFESISKDTIVSGIYVWIGKLTVDASATTSNPEQQSLNIGLFAGQNNGVLIDCVAGFLPSADTTNETIANIASSENLDSRKLEVATLVVNMSGNSTTNQACVYVGGLVGQNNGAVNMCWSYVDQEINNYSFESETDAINAKYRLYVGGLVGQQSITGSTANVYTMGRIRFKTAAGPTLDKAGPSYNYELGTFIGGLLGYDFAGCTSYGMSVINFSLLDEGQRNYVYDKKFSLLTGGMSGDISFTTLFSCNNINSSSLTYNTLTSGTTKDYYGLRNIATGLSINGNTNWMQNASINYGLPYLLIYKGNLATGQGVENDPYQIVEWQGLCDVSKNRVDSLRYYRLTRDLIATQGTNFSGFINLDGAGHSIYVNNVQNLLSSGSGYALFNTFRKSGVTVPVVKSLVVRYADYSVTGFGNDITFGGIALRNDEGGVIQNCAVIGTTTTANARIDFPTQKQTGTHVYGGIVANNAGVIEKCFTSLNFNIAFGVYGGIAGKLTGDGVVRECFTSGGPHLGNNVTYGGIVGIYDKSTTDDGIVNCYVRAKAITMSSAAVVRIGAFVGVANSSVSISTSYFCVKDIVLNTDPVSRYEYRDLTSEHRQVNGCLIGEQDDANSLSENRFNFLYVYDNGYPLPQVSENSNVSSFISTDMMLVETWATGTIWGNTNTYLNDVTPIWLRNSFLNNFSA